MEERINLLIDKIILPYYPWIKTYRWATDLQGKKNFYYFVITIDKDYTKQNNHTVTYDEVLELEEEVRMLFKMAAPDKNESFDAVQVLKNENNLPDK